MFKFNTQVTLKKDDSFLGYVTARVHARNKRTGKFEPSNRFMVSISKPGETEMTGCRAFDFSELVDVEADKKRAQRKIEQGVTG